MEFELKYIYIENYRSLSKIGINLNNQSNYKFFYQKNTLKHISTKISRIRFGNHITSVTTIAGQNASGKTTVAEVITAALATLSKGSMGFYYPFKGIIVFGSYIFVSKSTKILNSKSLVKEGFEIIRFNSSPFESMSDKIRSLFEKIGFIYYSNSFDSRLQFPGNNLYNISSYNLLQSDKYLSQHYSTNSQLLEEFRIISRDQISEIAIHEFEDSFRQVNFSLTQKITAPVNKPHHYRILLTYFANNRLIDIRDLPNDNPLRAYIMSALDVVLNSICEKYSHNTSIDNFIRIPKKQINFALITIYKINIICYFVKNNETFESIEELNTFIFTNIIPETISQKHRLLKLLLKHFTTLINNGNLTTTFSPWIEETVQHPKSYDWRLHTIGNFTVPANVVNIKCISNLIHLENEFFANNNSTNKRFCNYFISPNLSSGELSYYKLFSRLHKIINSPSAIDNLHNAFIVLIDEGEIGFHPAWKKKFLVWLIDFFNTQKYNYKIQLILTTHSPYLLSDMPPENCVLLRKNKNGMPEVVPENEINTFGANIHELLSTAFFLDDGLIGDFAKSNIQEAINLMIKWQEGGEIKSSDRDFVDYIISIISDEIVKYKLIEMYNNIFKK
jgi:predicted ATP-binding protein involved in virulence